MNILVTGGTGFLGERLAVRLGKMGYHVTAMGRNQAKGKELAGKGIRFIYNDLSIKESTIEHCQGMDYIFHCAALSAPWGKYEDFYASNVIGTKNIIEGAMSARVKRMIHVSTPSIYFKNKERLDVKEEDALPKKFINHYAETKFLAEKEVDEAFKEGLPVITIRPRAIFGPGDTSIIPRLIKVNREGFVPVFNENVTIDLTYVENVVDALLLCMDSPEKTLGQKYNISNGEKVNLHQVLHMLFDELGERLRVKKINVATANIAAKLLKWHSHLLKNGQEPKITNYSITILSKSQTINIEKAKRELGYVPKVSIQEGIEYFSQWWKEEEHD
ncbi:NAD-dependent epimerase/dehydratase family protein [Heyndrickxia oleronia]|uniref:NAD-dependent epimerase/dehydratase family protein n=1 Tax=Heyndrickxia oleronia TaxID=38875 RepID=UPI001C0EC9B3|nr:NAD-dependent epimerase/dehydratase family protein [Heyndrickxia oleronia]MBU5214243.1 NAD-dependent epimerase/dehydratase family protein [Heyndrickxia oleronia]